jgi:hypothetical protein
MQSTVSLRHLLIWGLGAMALACSDRSSAGAESADQPQPQQAVESALTSQLNVLFIALDDFRPEKISATRFRPS